MSQWEVVATGSRQYDEEEVDGEKTGQREENGVGVDRQTDRQAGRQEV